MRFITILIPLIIQLNAASAQSTDITCVSGNCKNGKGRIRVASRDNQEFEASFSKGYIMGPVKAYDKNGQLLFEGSVSNYRLYGEGKVYARDDAGKTYVLSQGTYSFDKLQNGTVMNEDGNVVSRGDFDTSGNLISGWELVSYHDKRAYLYQSKWNQKDKDGNDIYSGEFKIHESPDDAARPFYQTYYNIRGQRNGLTKVWDYENGLQHWLYYRDGQPEMEQGKYRASISTIADTKTMLILAMEVEYPNWKDDPFTFVPSVTQGIFYLEEGIRKKVSIPAGAVSLAEMKAAFALSTEIIPFKTFVSTPEDEKAKSERLLKALAPKDRRTPASKAAFQEYRDKVTRIGREAIRVLKNTTYRNYRTSESILKMYLDEVKAACNSILSLYRSELNDDMIKEVNETLATAETKFKLGLRIAYPDH